MQRNQIQFWYLLVDNEIDDFLKEEIKAEQQNLKQLVDISGFVVKQEGAELTFTKTHGSEKYEHFLVKTKLSTTNAVFTIFFGKNNFL